MVQDLSYLQKVDIASTRQNIDIAVWSLEEEKRSSK